MDTQEHLIKFRGPSFRALLEFAAIKKHSLLREVEICSPEELSAIVVGLSVHEVFKDMPERNILLRAMESIKRKQSKLEREKIFLWMNAHLPSRVLTPNMNRRTMRSMDMRMFLARYPLQVLPHPVFKPFIPIVKRFLLVRLFKFRVDNILYDGPPDFPPEDQLPRIVNALGPMQQLEVNFPHIARVKHEMILNITHFTITYCLDWICEILFLGSDRYGFVTYSYPTIEFRTEETSVSRAQGSECLGSDPEVARNRRAVEDGCGNDDDCISDDTYADDSGPSRDKSSKLSETVIANRKRDRAEEVEGIALSNAKSTPYQQIHVTKDESQLVSSQKSFPFDKISSLSKDIDDDWGDMLNVALEDPNLAPHYKTMFRCLVASNRDLKNLIALMKSQLP